MAPGGPSVPGVFGLPGFGIASCAAFQTQSFRTPSYSEIALRLIDFRACQRSAHEDHDPLSQL